MAQWLTNWAVTSRHSARWLAAFVVVVAIVLMPSSAWASDRASFSVSGPVDGSITARAGDTVRPSVLITNLLDEPVAYSLTVVSVSPGDNGIVLISPNANALTASTKITALATVDAHQEGPAALEIFIPKDTPDGTYLVGVLAAPVNSVTAGVTNQLQILSHVSVTVGATGGPVSVKVNQHINRWWSLGNAVKGDYTLTDPVSTGLTVRHGVSIGQEPGPTSVITKPSDPGTFLYGNHEKTFHYKWNPKAFSIGLARPKITSSFTDVSGHTTTSTQKGPLILVATPLAVTLFVVGLGGIGFGGRTMIKKLRSEKVKTEKSRHNNRFLNRKVRIMAAGLALAMMNVALSSFNLPTANAAALTAVSFTTSHGVAGDTNVRYGWSFTTATTASISAITFTVPSGTAGPTLLVVDNFGIGAGTATLSGNTVTYAITSPVPIAAGTPIALTMDGFTNTPVAGTYTSDVSTSTDGPTSSSSPVVMASSANEFNVVVNPALAFSDSATSVPVHLGSTDDQSVPTTLNVSSNAASGYQILARATPLTAAGKTLAATSTGTSIGFVSGSFPVNSWGYALSTPANGGSGVISRSGVLASDQFVGYSSSGQSIFAQTGPTAGDSAVVTNRFKVDINQASGIYTGTLIYTAICSY